MNSINSLVIDDDPNIPLILKNILDDSNHIAIETASNEREAKLKISQKNYEIIFLDLILEDKKGEDLIEFIIDKQPKSKIIILTGRKDIQIAAECLQKGAFDFVEKPILPEILLNIISHIEMLLESNDKKIPIKDKPTLKDLQKFSRDLIIGSDPTTLKTIEDAYQIGKTDYHVLIQGPTGSGKELFAEYIHRCSMRKGAFIKINIAGVDDNFFSDTLFGHKKQSFTGANSELKGLIEEADGGTILLDEIGDLTLNSQVKLLRLLQFSEYYPIGSNKPSISNVRFLFATNINLPSQVEKGLFREDLLYRIMAHQVTIAPLSKRKESLEELIYFFIARECKSKKRQMSIPTREFIDKLNTYNFPGNIRELEYIIKNSLLNAQTKYLQADLLQFDINHEKSFASTSFSNSIKSIPDEALPTLKELSDQLIKEVLFRMHGNQTKTAKVLGISQQALNQRIKKQNTDLPQRQIIN